MSKLPENVLFGRSQVCFHFGRLIKCSPSEKADLITKTAIKLGFVEERQQITGNTLTKYAKDKNFICPLWVAVTCVYILCENTDWTPENDPEYFVWADSFIRINNIKNISDIDSCIIPKCFNVSHARTALKLCLSDT